MGEILGLKGKIGFTQNLLILAVLLAPFTELRFSVVGLSEIIIAIVLIASIPKILQTKSSNLRFTNFWIRFLFILILSSIFNILFFNRYGVIDGWYDFFSYIFVLFSVFLFENKIKTGEIVPYVFIEKIFFRMSILLIILYGISFFTRSLLGMSLFYYERFAPLVNNPHKIAIFSSVLPFFGLLVLKNVKTKKEQIIIIALILLDILITIKSETSKSMLGILIGFSLFFMFNYLSKKMIKLAIIIALIFVVVIFLKYDLIGALVNYFNELDYNGGRSLIYGVGINQFILSPFIGYGFDSSIIIDGIKTDAHQTMITIGLQGGIIALILFMSMLSNILKVLTKDVILFIAFIPILLYILGGDIMRNNYVWILILLMYYCSLKLIKTKKNENFHSR
ncbi:O-antigen ligase family protein [Aureivirga marina]|uniref:O-antigen ligase family protein n=1 Tax=Aureivirga marina TaxID=1182451 RepID=UPI0018CAB44F|nr:O-antigen ligase family protein [Aureivirga marina]